MEIVTMHIFPILVLCLKKKHTDTQTIKQKLTTEEKAKHKTKQNKEEKKRDREGHG